MKFKVEIHEDMPDGTVMMVVPLVQAETVSVNGDVFTEKGLRRLAREYVRKNRVVKLVNVGE